MASIRRAQAATSILLVIAGLVLSGCNDGGSSTSTAGGASANSVPASSAMPGAKTATNGGGLAIAGTPSTTAVVDTDYAFHPTTADAVGTLTFAIMNKPDWAVFDASTGALSGKPTAADVGTSAKIAISVSDGAGSATLASFSISVVSPQAPVTLSWTPPSQNTNGTVAADLSGYHIYYGSKSTALNQVVTVAGADKTNYLIANLPAGTWYFAIAAYNKEKVESALSAVVPIAL
jgi:Putative Ig domain